MKPCKETSFVTTQGRVVIPATIDSLKGILKREPGTKPVTQLLLEAHALENGGWASSPTSS